MIRLYTLRQQPKVFSIKSFCSSFGKISNCKARTCFELLLLLYAINSNLTEYYLIIYLIYYSLQIIIRFYTINLLISTSFSIHPLAIEQGGFSQINVKVPYLKSNSCRSSTLKENRSDGVLCDALKMVAKSL